MVAVATAEKEVELWEKLSTPYHPAILQLVEIVQTAAGYHLITEVMSHGELFDALDRIDFSEQTCRMVTLQLASGIAHLVREFVVAQRPPPRAVASARRRLAAQHRP